MFFKKKEKEMKKLLAPVSGKLIAIEKVNDPVFAQKMMGDGFAIDRQVNSFMPWQMEKSVQYFQVTMRMG